MTIQLYVDYVSQPARAVIAFCHINNIPVQLHEVRIARMQHLEEEFGRINPMRRVPAIRDTENGLVLGESHAIMAYLGRKFNKRELTQGKDEKIHAKIEEYLHYHHANTRKCALLLYASLFSKLYPVQQAVVPDPKILQKEVHGIVAFINENYFKDSHFLIGSALTVADLAAYFEIQTLSLLDFDLTGYPKVRAWLQELGNYQCVRVANKGYVRVQGKLRALRANL